MTLDETIAVRAGERTVPLILAGTLLPTTKRETLSTSSDGQESVRCRLAAGSREVAFVEVGVKRAPRGVPKVALEIRVDEDGTVSVTLRGEDGQASAMFSVATRR